MIFDLPPSKCQPHQGKVTADTRCEHQYCGVLWAEDSESTGCIENIKDIQRYQRLVTSLRFFLKLMCQTVSPSDFWANSWQISASSRQQSLRRILFLTELIGLHSIFIVQWLGCSEFFLRNDFSQDCGAMPCLPPIKLLVGLYHP